MRRDESYVTFVSARWSALYRTSYLLTGHPAQAEDLLQSALLKAYVVWGRIEAMSAPEAYVRTMLVNAFVSQRRRRSESAEVAHADVPASVVPSHEDRIVDRSSLWSGVQALPPRQRAVVVLRYYEDLSEREIAAALGCSPGTVKSQAADALRSLRAALATDVRASNGEADG